MMYHVKRTLVTHSGDRVTSYYWTTGSGSTVATRTSFQGDGWGPETHWSGVDSFTPDRGVARFFQGLLMLPGASIASVR